MSKHHIPSKSVPSEALVISLPAPMHTLEVDLMGPRLIKPNQAAREETLLLHMDVN